MLKEGKVIGSELIDPLESAIDLKIKFSEDKKSYFKYPSP